MTHLPKQADLPERAVIREVGLRDGLQSIGTLVSTARKCEWIRDAVAAGQRVLQRNPCGGHRQRPRDL